MTLHREQKTEQIKQKTLIIAVATVLAAGVHEPALAQSEFQNRADMQIRIDGLGNGNFRVAEFGRGAKVSVVNHGPAAAHGAGRISGGYLIDLSVLQNGKAIASTRLAATADVRPKGSRSYSADGKWIPKNLPPGPYNLCARIQSGTANFDANPANNALCGGIVVVAENVPPIKGPTVGGQQPAPEKVQRSDLTIEVDKSSRRLEAGGGGPRLIALNAGDGLAAGTRSGRRGYSIRYVLYRDKQAVGTGEVVNTLDIPPGGKRDYQLNEYWLKRNPTPGIYRFCVQIDPDNAVDERDEKNNAVCPQVEIVAPRQEPVQQVDTCPQDEFRRSDLVPRLTGISRGTIRQGQSLGSGARIAVENTGCSVAPGARPGRRGYEIALNFYRGTRISKSERWANTADIAAGEHREFDISASRLTRDLAPGAYRLCADVDPNRGVDEFSENNNRACQTITIAATQQPAAMQSDLVVSFGDRDDVPKLRPGEPIGGIVTLEARNIGRAPAPGNRGRGGQNGYVVDLILSTDQRAPKGFRPQPPRFSEDVLVENGRIGETRDLSPQSAYPLDLSDKRILADTPSGTYYLCARIDPGGIVKEANENNNFACQRVEVVTLPDLIVSISGTPDRIRPGEALGAKATVKAANRGRGPAPGQPDMPRNYGVEVVLSTDGTILPGRRLYEGKYIEDVLLVSGWYIDVPPLTPGQSIDLDIAKATIPADTPPGQYQVCARIDPDNLVEEHEDNKRNNFDCRGVEVLAPPDLFVKLDGIPDKMEPGGSLGSDAIMETGNQGGAAIVDQPAMRSYGVEVVISSDREIPAGRRIFAGGFAEDGLLLGGWHPGVPDPAVTGSHEIAIGENVIPQDTPAGDYFICARVDPANTVDENDRTINVDCKQITVQVKPDLVVSFDGVPTVFKPGSSLGQGALVTASNGGNIVAPGAGGGRQGYIIDIIISGDDRVPDGPALESPTFKEDMLLEGGRLENTRDLTPGETDPIDISGIRLPADTPAGEFKICARIDPSDAVDETEEDVGNFACHGISVAIPAVDLYAKLNLNETQFSRGETLKAGSIETGLIPSSDTNSPISAYAVVFNLTGAGGKAYNLSAHLIDLAKQDNANVGKSAIVDVAEIRIPESIVPGTYELCAFANPDGAVTEITDNNNRDCQTVKIVPIAGSTRVPNLTPPQVPLLPDRSLQTETEDNGRARILPMPTPDIRSPSNPGIPDLDVPGLDLADQLPSGSDVVETPGADLLFDFAFDSPILSPPGDYRNRTMMCDNACSQSKVRTTLMYFGWPIDAEDEGQDFRLDIALSHLGFEQDNFYSVPFNSQIDDVALPPALSEASRSVNIRPEYRLRKLSGKQIHAFGKRTSFVKMEGFLPTGTYWLRLLKRTPEGWRPEAWNICIVRVCPRDSIR